MNTKREKKNADNRQKKRSAYKGYSTFRSLKLILGKQSSDFEKTDDQSLKKYLVLLKPHIQREGYKKQFDIIIQILKRRQFPDNTTKKPTIPNIEVSLLKKTASRASRNAINENKALNIPVTYLESKNVVQELKGIKKTIHSIK